MRRTIWGAMAEVKLVENNKNYLIVVIYLRLLEANELATDYADLLTPVKCLKTCYWIVSIATFHLRTTDC